MRLLEETTEVCWSVSDFCLSFRFPASSHSFSVNRAMGERLEVRSALPKPGHLTSHGTNSSGAVDLGDYCDHHWRSPAQFP